MEKQLLVLDVVFCNDYMYYCFVLLWVWLVQLDVVGLFVFDDIFGIYECLCCCCYVYFIDQNVYYIFSVNGVDGCIVDVFGVGLGKSELNLLLMLVELGGLMFGVR